MVTVPTQKKRTGEQSRAVRRSAGAFQCALVVIMACGFGFTAAVVAQPDADAPSEPIPIESESIEDDRLIEARIKAIFSELAELSDVGVEVMGGVVTLKGDVANEASAKRAGRLASRLTGVVTVEDEIRRTLAVADNVLPIVESARQSLRSLVRGLPLFGLAILLLIAFVLLGGMLSRQHRIWQKLAPNPFLAELLAQAVRIVVVFAGLILALNLLGAGSVVSTILGGAGVIGLAVGFAVRDTIENYISSIMLSLRQPFRARDYVVINDLDGIVIRLTSRATILMTLDGNHLRIPNSTVFKGVILNYSTNPERRFDFELGVDADDDPVEAMKVGLDAMREQQFILTEPEPFALIKTIGDSNIVLSFYGWVDQRETDFVKARSLTIQTVMSALDGSGFTMPEPIYRLRFDSTAKPDSADESKSAERAQEKTQAGSELVPKQIKAGQGSRRPAAEVNVKPGIQVIKKVEAEMHGDNSADLLDDSMPRE